MRVHEQITVIAVSRQCDLLVGATTHSRNAIESKYALTDKSITKKCHCYKQR